MNDLDRDDGFQFILIPSPGLTHIQIICTGRKERFDVSISGKLEGMGASSKEK
jgi:hypothetical protein